MEIYKMYAVFTVRIRINLNFHTFANQQFRTIDMTRIWLLVDQREIEIQVSVAVQIANFRFAHKTIRIVTMFQEYLPLSLPPSVNHQTVRNSDKINQHRRKIKEIKCCPSCNKGLKQMKTTKKTKLKGIYCIVLCWIFGNCKACVFFL